MIQSVSPKTTRHPFSGDSAMTLQIKRLIDEISQTAPKHEIAGLIEVLAFVRQSRISLMQEAFSKDASVADAKLQLPDEPRVRSPSRSEVRGYEQHGRW
jgi:hypothetical protein